MSRLAAVSPLFLLVACCGADAIDCEVQQVESSFLQTERILEHVEQPWKEKPWLQPALQKLQQARIPDWFAHAAPRPKAHITTGAKLGIGAAALLMLGIIPVCLGEEEQRGQRAAAPYTWRMFIGIMCLTMYLLNYADRYNISVAIITISEDKGYDKRMQGFIQSAVYLGILPGTLTFGHLASPEMMGPFCGLSLACFCWSAATILTPICADSSLGLLIFVRIALGFFEAGAAPCVYQLSHQWFPKVGTGHLLAGTMTGQCAGAAIANAFGSMADWRIVFYIFGCSGLLWCVLFSAFGSNTPDTHRYISKEELFAIQDAQREEESGRQPSGRFSMGFFALLRRSVVWGMIIGEFTFCFLWYFWLSWMPSFFHDTFGMSTGDSGALGMLSFAVGMPAPFLWSKLFASCFQRNGPSSLLNLRLAFICVTFLGAALGTGSMLLARKFITPVLAMLLVMLTIVMLCAKIVGFAALIVDCGGAANSAKIGGLIHTASAVSGSLSNVIVGHFLATPALGYTGVFVLCICIALLGLFTLLHTVQVAVLDSEEEECK